MEMHVSFRVEPAVLADAPELADVYTRTRRQAYGPIFGEGFDDGNLEDHVGRWQRILLRDVTLNQPPEETFVARLDGAKIGGFCSVGPAEDDASRGEVIMLYVAPEHWGSGVADALFAAGVEYLRGRGFQELTLWVLEPNVRARRFYERRGWVADGTRRPSFRDPSIWHLRYSAHL
jgi:ribosomal protein S18 acetylase RimI-like enzyme